jgi:hypothetical protein
VKPLVRSLVAMLAVVLVAAPASILLTLLLLPFWSWLEASYAVESVGHSGPAEWCYVSVYVLLIAAGGLVLALLQRRAPSRPSRDSS